MPLEYMADTDTALNEKQNTRGPTHVEDCAEVKGLEDGLSKVAVSGDDQLQGTGHIDCLSPEQEGKLLEMWALVIELLAMPVRPGSPLYAETGSRKKTRELTDVLSRNASTHSLSSISESSLSRFLSVQSHPLSAEFWPQLATDDPDVLLLRFLRARKWSVPEAFAMMFEALKWRRSFGVREMLIKGDEAAVRKHLREGGKAFFWGTDKEGRLIVVLPARLHDRNAQTLEENMAHTVFLMETGRRSMLPGTETVTLVFDLKDATLSSFDVASMQFMIQCFQSYYPESLGRCYVLNAPWIFWGFWRVVKPFLDPVVVAKIVFIEDPAAELPRFIDPEFLLAEFGGKCKYKFRYHPPEPQHFPMPMPPDREAEVEAALEQLKPRFIDSTLHLHSLLNAPAVYSCSSMLDVPKLVSRWRVERKEAVRQLRNLLKEVDRATVPLHLYERVGIVQREEGTHDWQGYMDRYFANEAEDRAPTLESSSSGDGHY